VNNHDKIFCHKKFVGYAFICPNVDGCVLVCQNAEWVLLTCLSLYNTQARAVNLIHAVLCDDEGVTQARGC